MSYFKKILAAGCIILVVAFGFWYKFGGQRRADKGIRPDAEKTAFQGVPEPEMKKVEPSSKPQETAPADKNKLPESVLIGVPFLVQAPFGKWDALHEDACEEASLIMVKHFLEKDKAISAEQGEKEIQAMVKFESQNGFGKSVTAEELGQLVKKYYNLANYRVGKNITIEEMKEELAAGRPIIVPAAGKILPNPNFKDGGPLYHMLVVVGYDKNGFITNDPGTRKGEGFRYTFNALYNAIHDWNSGDVLDGQKTYLLFE